MRLASALRKFRLTSAGEELEYGRSMPGVHFGLPFQLMKLWQHIPERITMVAPKLGE